MIRFRSVSIALYMLRKRFKIRTREIIRNVSETILVFVVNRSAPLPDSLDKLLLYTMITCRPISIPLHDRFGKRFLLFPDSLDKFVPSTLWIFWQIIPPTLPFCHGHISSLTCFFCVFFFRSGPPMNNATKTKKNIEIFSLTIN